MAFLSCAGNLAYKPTDIRVTVLSVYDGDTLTVLLENGRKIRVRLYGIDAPEKNQLYGEESHQNLVRLCEGQKALIDLMAADRYRRIVAQIYCQGINANINQLSQGLAWVYTEYLDDTRIADNFEFYPASFKHCV